MEVDAPKDEAATDNKQDSDKPSEGDASKDKAAASEDTEMKEEASAKSSEEAKSEAEQQPPVKSPPKKEMRTEKRKKIVSKTIDLPVTSRVMGALSRDKMEAAVEQEKKLVNCDLNEAERLTSKNSVEEYIYSIREKISEELEVCLFNFIVRARHEAPSENTIRHVSGKLAMVERATN